MKQTLLLLLCTATFFTASATARADIVYSNFSPAGGSGFLGGGTSLGGFTGLQRSLAVSFKPSSNYQLSSVDIPTINEGSIDDFILSIRDDVNGSDLVSGHVIFGSTLAIRTWTPTGIGFVA